VSLLLVYTLRQHPIRLSYPFDLSFLKRSWKKREQEKVVWPVNLSRLPTLVFRRHLLVVRLIYLPWETRQGQHTGQHTHKKREVAVTILIGGKPCAGGDGP
jgi:hypothetical protein